MPLYRSIIRAANPNAYYRLGTIYSTTTRDETVNAFDAVIIGGATSTTGAIVNDPNAAMFFDGNTGYVALPTALNTFGWSLFSFEVWVMPTPGTPGYSPRLLANNNVATNSAGIDIYVNPAYTTGTFTLYTSSGVQTATFGPMPAGQWTYIAGVYNGATISAYTNGVLSSSVSATGTITASPSPFSIANNPATAGLNFPGAIDEVAIYNSDLTALIPAHYQAGLTNTTGPLTVEVNRAPIFVTAGSVTIDKAIGKRSTAAFTAHLQTIQHFQQDQQIAIYDQSGALAFNGFITTPKEQQIGYQKTLDVTITCVDMHRLADKRVIAASYVNRTCGYIVQDILNTILASEGVTAGLIYDGQTPSTTLYPALTLYPGGNVGLVPQATFSYATVAAALDALAKAASQSGVPYYWQIDQNKQIYFVPYTMLTNPTIVDGTTIEQVNNPPTVTRSNPLYRNTQYLLGGVAQTLPQTETRKGDGVATTWVMDFDLASAPTITLNGAAKGVGIKGVSTGTPYYWQQGSSIITQDSGQIKLVSTDVLSVSYIGQYPSVIISSNGAQISYEAGVDGTTGIVEQVDNDNTLTNVSNGLSEASQLLTLYGVQGLVLTFTTLQSIYGQGQLITVNLPTHGLYNAQLLISDVSVSDQTDGYNLWYTVTAVQGPYDTSWVQFFSKMLAQPQIPNAINVGTSQSVTLLAPFTMGVALTASFTALIYACPIVSTTLYPSLTLYPC